MPPLHITPATSWSSLLSTWFNTTTTQSTITKKSGLTPGMIVLIVILCIVIPAAIGLLIRYHFYRMRRRRELSAARKWRQAAAAAQKPSSKKTNRHGRTTFFNTNTAASISSSGESISDDDSTRASSKMNQITKITTAAKTTTPTDIAGAISQSSGLARDELLDERWRIVKSICAGSFGTVYEAVDTRDNKNTPVAIKVESVRASVPQLKMDLLVLRKLSGKTIHVCQLLDRGRMPNRCTYIVMTLLGQSLYDIQHQLERRRFTPATTARLAIQCLQGVQALHQVGFLHRDIKSANFVMGRTAETRRIVHLIDFGLARFYWQSASDRRIRMPRPSVGFRGSVRYASLTAHYGLDLGRRDDLMSLFYVLIEFLVGRLPWRELDQEERRVARMKRTLGVVLVPTVNSMSEPYLEFGQQVMKLRYDDQPDYNALLGLFRRAQIVHRFPVDGPFEWEEKKVCVV